MRSLINPKLQAALLRNSLSILISPRARIPKHFQAGLFGPNIRHTILLGDQTRRGGLKAWFEAASGVTVDRSVCNRCRVVAVAVVVFDLGAEAFDGCPVVRLQDSSEDLGYLLSALYDGRKKFVITRFYVPMVL